MSLESGFPDPEKHDDELPAYYIASVGRALTLLGAFIDRSKLTVSEASEMLEVSPSTAHRILQMLLFHGYVEQGERRVYVRGPRLESISRPAQRPRDVESVALPHLRALRDELRGTAHLLTLEGNGARFVTGVEWRDETRVAAARVGWLLPAHTLAGGKAMLARLSSAQLLALYPDGLPVTRYGRINTLTQLQAELRDIRASGYARSRESHENVSAVGVALQIPASHAAISVAWSDRRFPNGNESEIVAALRSVAQDISISLA